MIVGSPAPVKLSPSISKYLVFLTVGSTGVLLNLTLVWLLVRFALGAENYYTAYIAGTTLNLIYNFSLHTIVTFRTQDHHSIRFAVFVLYNLGMTALQVAVVRMVTPMAGVRHYLVVTVPIPRITAG